MKKFTIKEMCGFVEFLEKDEIVELLEKLDLENINLPKICRLYTKLHKYNIETSIFFTEVEETNSSVPSEQLKSNVSSY